MRNESQCLKKRSYPTQTEAQRVADRAFARRNVKLRIYECPNCRWFHLTKRPARNGQAA